MFDLRRALGALVSIGMPAADVQSPVLDTDEAATYVHRTPNFVRRVLRYEIPSIQRGERQPLFFYKADLDLWLARNTREPVSR